MKFPSLKKRKLYERELPSTALLAIPPLGAAILAILKLTWWAAPPPPPCPGAASAPASSHGLEIGLSVFILAWLLVGSVFKVMQARSKDEKLDELDSPERLLGCLHVMYAATLATKGLSSKNPDHLPKLRMTIHAIEKEDAVQIVEYVGGKPRGDKEDVVGRKRSARCGVVGSAYTSGGPVSFRRETPDALAYKREMKENWFMLDAEIETLDLERMSHFAVPIGGNDGRIAAVVFMDSDDSDFFDDPTQNLVISHVIGLAQYVEFGYT